MGITSPVGDGRGTDALTSSLASLVERVMSGIIEVRGRGRGLGAGVIWSADGKVMTNHHVVAGGGWQPRVILSDGRELQASVVATDPALDLGLLRVEATDLPAVPVADSSKLRVGELVVAIGHPFGMCGLVTTGIVSGVGEIGDARRGRTAPYIRTDAHLAPGNSGGPLLNARGEIIGINAMVFGGDLGVAIPSHVANEWIAGLKEGRAYLGVRVQPVEIPVRVPWGRWRGQAAGLLVVGVEEDSPASRSGLTVGDVLLSADGSPLNDGQVLLKQLAGRREGDKLNLQLLRAGQVGRLEVPLARLQGIM